MNNGRRGSYPGLIRLGADSAVNGLSNTNSASVAALQLRPMCGSEFCPGPGRNGCHCWPPINRASTTGALK